VFLCGVPTIDRKSESKKKSIFFPFRFYSPLGKVRIGCNWGFGFEWFSHPVTLLYSSFDSEFSPGRLRWWMYTC
jgi:hypothetical protein